MSDRESRSARRRRRSERKDRLIQTRVAEDLEQALKQEAARRRLTVSHLIRNTLEDAFDLVEDVTADVEQLVSGSVELAAAVGRDARRIASIVRGTDDVVDPVVVSVEPAPVPEEPAMVKSDRATVSEPPAVVSALEQVYGWNRVIANRASRCTNCAAEIERGANALVGLTEEPGPRIWLCEDCGEQL